MGKFYISVNEGPAVSIPKKEAVAVESAPIAEVAPVVEAPLAPEPIVVEKIVEVPVEVIKEVIVEKRIEVPMIQTQYITKEVPVEITVEKIVQVPVEVVKEVIVEIEKIVDKEVVKHDMNVTIIFTVVSLIVGFLIGKL